MSDKKQLDEQANFLLYTGEDGHVRVEVFLQDDTVWLTQKAIGNLFGKSKATISEHLKGIYAEGELQVGATVRKFRTVQLEGGRQVERELEYYNLDAITSVGYRVNSRQVMQFRIWATRSLKEFSAPIFLPTVNHRGILGSSTGSGRLTSIHCQLSTVNCQLNCAMLCAGNLLETLHAPD